MTRVVVLLLSATVSTACLAQEPCPRVDLPAYAHNDYENARPLFDALRLGYRGVEADIFLVQGQLRVGHDRKQATKNATFEQLYLKPLAELAQRCKGLAAEQGPLMLNVELKEAARPAFDSLLALLVRYREVLSYTAPESLRDRTAAVMLVGWHPPIGQLSKSQLGSFRLQYKLTRPDQPLPQGENSKYVWMASVDYGKSIAGWLKSTGRRERWLKRLRQVRDSTYETRVYNVPRDSVIYRRLLAAHVTLIGTETLEATRELLKPLIQPSRCYAIEAGPWTVPKDSMMPGQRDIPELPEIVELDTSHVESGFFAKSAWRELKTYSRGRRGRKGDWEWLPGIGSVKFTNSGGDGGTMLDFRIAGDSIYGRAEVLSDMVGVSYPSAPARGRAVTCPLVSRRP